MPFLAAPAASRTAASPPRAATTATGSARAALWLRPRLVDDEIAVAEETSVQHLNGLGRFFLGGHLDESESSRPARELIRHDANGFDSPGLGKQLPQIFLCGLEREIADEQLCWHREPPAAIRSEWSLSPAHRRLWGCLLDIENLMCPAPLRTVRQRCTTVQTRLTRVKRFFRHNVLYFTNLCRTVNVAELGTARRLARRARCGEHEQVRLPAARVHLQMRVPLQFADLDQRPPLA